MMVMEQNKPAPAGEKMRQSAADAAVSDLVVGLGATGLSFARYLKRNGASARFADSRKDAPGQADLQQIFPHAEVQLGPFDAGVLKSVSRLLVSPGVSEQEPILVEARRRELEIVSDIEVFAREASAPIVAITGSNGKSTVTTLVKLMCDAAGVRGLAGANLGEPALDLLAAETPDYYVLELSSFQLQRTRSLSARVAAVLNVSPDHLDWHGTEDAYRAAKYRIYKGARFAVVNRDDPPPAAAVIGARRTISFGADAPDDIQYGLRTEDGITYLARGKQLLLASHEVALRGRHNYLNALAALAIGDLMELPMAAMLQVLHEFPGLPHRMRHVATRRGVEFINDSKATNTGAAVASIESVDNTIVLIAGGDGKGGDFSALARALQGKLRGAVLMGKDAQRIGSALADMAPTVFVDDMQQAVAEAANMAVEGDAVLLAPACASIDQYKNYAQRGDMFAAAVEALGR